MEFFYFILSRVYSASWICMFMSSVKFRKFSVIVSSITFPAPHSLPSPSWGSDNTNVRSISSALLQGRQRPSSHFLPVRIRQNLSTRNRVPVKSFFYILKVINENIVIRSCLLSLNCVYFKGSFLSVREETEKKERFLWNWVARLRFHEFFST